MNEPQVKPDHTYRPPLQAGQVNRILAKIDSLQQSQEEFFRNFSKILRPRNVKDGARAALRWFERVKAGTAGVASDRMAALIKAFDGSLDVFEEYILCEPGFCREHYGPDFVKNMNEWYSTLNRFGAAVLDAPASASSKGRARDASRSALAEFFGPAMTDVDKYVQLLFPKRSPKIIPNEETELQFALEDDFTFKDKDGNDQTNVHPEGVTGYLAFEDVRAAIHVANFVTDKTQKDVWARHENRRALDEWRERHDTCTFVFGLGFTAATRDIEEDFANELFYIYADKARNANFWTDFFALKFRRVRNAKRDKMLPVEISLRSKRDIALIVRAFDKSTSKGIASAQPLFICAGRTAVGTSAAAHFLVKHWEELAGLYKTFGKKLERDSLAVVIEHRAAKPSDHSCSSPLQIEESAKFYLLNEKTKKKCIAWA